LENSSDTNISAIGMRWKGINFLPVNLSTNKPEKIDPINPLTAKKIKLCAKFIIVQDFISAIKTW
jgi:hypothetical protein